MAVKLNATKKLLVERIRAKRRELWDWHLALAKDAPPPFYSSVDLRDSGHKIAPVDSNLYPAGFNNICPEDQRTAPPIARAQLEAAYRRVFTPDSGGGKSPKRVLILPESNTTNLYYLENLYYLRQILIEAGFDVRLGWFGPPPEGTSGVFELKTQSEKPLSFEPIHIVNGRMSLSGFEPDAVLLNNDFSSGYPKELNRLAQPIIPSHTLGWHSRKKSEHFTHYNRLAGEFAKLLDIDPWLIQVDTVAVDHVDFNEDQGIDRAAEAAGQMLERLRAAYAERGLKQKPFVFVKNNAGTYGMGITVVHEAQELLALNRREKNKMSVGKNRRLIDSVVIQEGVPTATLVDRLAAEPVIYLMGCELIGGFLRTNSERGTEDNLNSRGMVFRKLCMSDLREPSEAPARDVESDPTAGEDNPLELIYGSIARLSALATGIEIREHPES